MYLWLIAAAGAVTGLTAGWAVAHRSVVTGAPVLAQFALLAVVAQHFPLPLGPKRKFDLAQAAHFAIILLAGAPVATILVAASEAIGQATLALRRDRDTGWRRRGTSEVLFNTCQVSVAAGLAALVGVAIRAVARGEPEPALGAESALRAVAVGATLYLANSAAVAVMVGLHRGRNPLGVWLEGRVWSALQSGGLLVLGAVAAHAAAESSWAPLAMAIRDHGVGIPPEHRERIFEQCYQAGANAKAGGLGLGLYIARRAVELHGGTIGVESPPDGGTRFRATLPVLVPPEPAPAGRVGGVTQSAAA